MKSKKSFLRILFFGVTSVLLVGVFLVSIIRFGVDIYAKYQEKKGLEEQLALLKEKESELTVDVARMQDSEYVARYLREKFYYSKKGEYIIRLPE